MASTVVTIATVLQTVRDLIALAQGSVDTGHPISQADFDAAVAQRNAALDRLDADIAAAKAEGR